LAKLVVSAMTMVLARANRGSEMSVRMLKYMLDGSETRDGRY
jgi:hypothetical protein